LIIDHTDESTVIAVLFQSAVAGGLQVRGVQYPE